MTPALAVLASNQLEPAGPPAWVWLMLLVACAVATRTDLRAMRIPNWLTLPLFALGVSYWSIVDGLPGTGDALLGSLICGGIFIGAYILAGGGAGDAKLMLAMGAWVGSDPAVVLVLGVTFAGFLWSMIVTIKRLGIGAVPITILHGVTMTRLEFRKVLRSGVTTTAAPEPTDQMERPEHWMPYAPAILVGTIASWWYWNTYGAIL